MLLKIFIWNLEILIIWIKNILPEKKFENKKFEQLLNEKST